MIAAPRLPTPGRNSFSIHAWSSTTSAACSPPTWAWNRSGYIVGEWLPHTPIGAMSLTGTATLSASCAIARLWSRRIIEVNRSRGMSGALFIAIRQLVLAGLPTTSTFTSAAARVVQRLALDGEDLAVLAEQLGALHALRARPRADEQRDVHTVERVVGVVVQVEPGEQRERAVDELHRHALERPHRLRDLEQAQVDRLVRAEQLPAGDAEHDAVADLAGCAGDGDSYGVAHRFISWCCAVVG